MESIELIKEEILLDNDKIKYESGETISGTANIALNGELDMSRVNIVLRGMSEVKWVEDCGNSLDYREGGMHYDVEQYLNSVYSLPDNIRNTSIIKGKHSIPFEFKLPDDIPSSFETSQGFIKYWVELFIGGLLTSEVYHEKTLLTVESPIRRNLDLSVGGKTELDLGLLKIGSGKVRIDGFIGKKGHIPGESVEVHCLVTNLSTVAVTPRAKLYQLEIFMAKEIHKSIGYSSDAVVGEKVNAGQTREQTIIVQIPKVVSLSIKTRLISIKYFIHLKLDIPHTLDIHLTLPIIITNQNALNDA